MKKIISLLLIVSMVVLVFASCGDDSNGDPITSTNVPVATTTAAPVVTTAGSINSTTEVVVTTATPEIPVEFETNGDFVCKLLSAGTNIYGKEAEEGEVPTGIAIAKIETAIADLVVPSSASYKGTTYPVISIGYMIGNTLLSESAKLALTTLTLPQTTKVVCPNSFVLCKSLTTVDFGTSLVEVGTMAFWHCESLTSVVLPSGTKTIGSSAFASCTSLKSVVIPSTVETIGASAFAGCIQLKDVTIPSSFKDKVDSIFVNCPSINFTFVD